MGGIVRDPKRIDEMLEKVREAWELYPDMRLGQLLTVCARNGVLSGVEDEELLRGIKQYIDSLRKATGVLE